MVVSVTTIIPDVPRLLQCLEGILRILKSTGESFPWKNRSLHINMFGSAELSREREKRGEEGKEEEEMRGEEGEGRKRERDRETESRDREETDRDRDRATERQTDHPDVS